MENPLIVQFGKPWFAPSISIRAMAPPWQTVSHNQMVKQHGIPVSPPACSLQANGSRLDPPGCDIRSLDVLDKAHGLLVPCSDISARNHKSTYEKSPSFIAI